MEHDSATCEFCQAVATMDKIMAMIDGIPEWGIPLFDDAVQAVYDAAQDAEPILRCWAASREEHDNQA